MRKPTFGNVVEIPTNKGLSYAQYTHWHPQYGELIRVFDVLFEERPSDFGKLVARPVRFSTFFPFGAAIRRHIFHVKDRILTGLRVELSKSLKGFG